MAAKLFNRIRELRQQAGLTQAALGEAVGLGAASVAAIENGRQDATLVSALRLSELFGLAVQDIFRDHPFPGPDSDDGTLSLFALPRRHANDSDEVTEADHA